MRILFPLVLVVHATLLQAQELPGAARIALPKDTVDADELPPAFHTGRREALRALLPAHGVAVVQAATLKNRSNDVSYEFHQDPNFHYLSGVDEPGATLLIFKEPRVIR